MHAPPRRSPPLALLLAQPPDGGVHRHVTQVARGLADSGWRVVVGGPASYAGLHPGVEHVPLELDRAVRPGADARAARELAGLLRRERPALVHAHSSKAGALARAVRPAAPRVPVVYSPHGFAFNGHFDSELSRSAYRLVERALAPLASRVLCTCEAERALAASVGAAARTRVAYNGVEVLGAGDVDPRVAELATRGPVLSAVAVLRAGKGVETAIEALPAVLARHPDVRLVVGGDGPGRGQLEALARQVGVAERVVLLGHLDDPATLLRGATVHLNPSWAESFPYTVLEGMAAGLAVVATDVGGTREAIEDGRSGALVPPRDAGALGAAVTRLLDEPERREAVATAARERIARRFSVTGMIDAVEAAYRELVPGGR